MRLSRINGIVFDAMVRNGLANLRIHEKEVNDLNVFPVADGDTGTNMCLTLEGGLKSAEPTRNIGPYLKELSNGMLYGARGNSGVILSQLFKGMYLVLYRCGGATPRDMLKALISAYTNAYSAVLHPTEGTILTVAREAAESLRNHLERSTSHEAFFSIYIAEMKKSLATTPEMLPVLKEEGVVDSGALGYIYIFEGMLKYLQGVVLTDPGSVEDFKNENICIADQFYSSSDFEYGYCMEFVLQLLNRPGYSQNFKMERFTSDLEIYGSSIVAVADGTRVKIHVHTFRPEKIISMSREYGEFISFKLENMQLQHNEILREKTTADRKRFGVISVANGKGFIDTFKNLGCSEVIDGGATMNASSEEFVRSIEHLNAENTVILPNSKNILLAATQAVSLCGKDNITIIPTENVIEGYLALAMDIQDSDDISLRIKQMKSGVSCVVCLAQTTASNDYSRASITCRSGDEIVISGDEVLSSSSDWSVSIVDAIKSIEDLDSRETCIVFRGKECSDEDETLLRKTLSNAFPDMEFFYENGGQAVYRWLLGVY